MYNVLLTQRALKDLDALEKQVRIRIIKKLKEYASKPIRDTRKLESPKIGTYRFRVGDYRVVFDIEVFDIDGENLVVLRAGHRKTIYR
ncbi:MAG: type II toxin-antitoxin system RelE/ParE family toxin [Candidatus Methanoperedens sp.]|nr:type II toxin-antitoxin system RelE/ParE family toxin [Candidatus Methanoperedens sp.]